MHKRVKKQWVVGVTQQLLVWGGLHRDPFTQARPISLLSRDALIDDS